MFVHRGNSRFPCPAGGGYGKHSPGGGNVIGGSRHLAAPPWQIQHILCQVSRRLPQSSCQGDGRAVAAAANAGACRGRGRDGAGNRASTPASPAASRVPSTAGSSFTPRSNTLDSKAERSTQPLQVIHGGGCKFARMVEMRHHSTTAGKAASRARAPGDAERIVCRHAGMHA